MKNLDISRFFAEFNPAPKQITILAKLLKRVHKWWGIDYSGLHDSVIEATLLLAPGDLSLLSSPAFDLLKRCQNRVWAFNVRLDSNYDPFHEQTYYELFELLLSLGLIEESSLPDKLRGTKKVNDLRFLLKARGVLDNGKKEELINRVIKNYSTAEVENLVKGSILFNTTKLGDKALQTIAELELRIRVAFQAALVGTMDYFEARKEPAPILPPGVYYDDGEVRITDDDIRELKEAVYARSTATAFMKNEQQGTLLTFDLIHDLVVAIEANGNGWLAVSTRNDELACFVQCSFVQDYPWYFDARGDACVLSSLGFSETEGDLLPTKWVPSDKVVQTIFDTLRLAFNIELGSNIWLDYEIVSK
jgi:hypothetical protein